MKQQSQEVSVNSNDWGAVEVTSRDLVISRLMLMQGMSEKVSEGKAKLGDILNSVTNEVVATKDKSVELLPFYCTKQWVRSKKVGQRFEFVSSAPDNGEAMAFEETINGVHYKNEHQYTFFFLTKELSMPVVASFKSTSHKIGKQLFTLMYVNNKQAGLTPAASWVNLGTIIQKNDKGTYATLNVDIAGRSTQAELNECIKWIGSLRTMAVRVDDSHEGQAAGSDAATAARY